MRVSMEVKKKEAIKRLEMLGVLDIVIDDFKEGKVQRSERGGFLFYLNDEQKEKVAEFERESNALVYHVIYSNTGIGEMLNMLYVSDYKDEWEHDIEDIENGMTFAYVMNITVLDFSEIGQIGVKEHIGGLVRTW